MKTFTTIFLSISFFVGCGAVEDVIDDIENQVPPVPEKTEEEAKNDENEEVYEEVVYEREYERRYERTTVRTGRTTETKGSHDPVTLDRGLTFVQVKAILGAPDDTRTYSMGGGAWIYDKTSGVCEDVYRQNNCTVYFSKEGKVSQWRNIHASFECKYGIDCRDSSANL